MRDVNRGLTIQMYLKLTLVLVVMALIVALAPGSEAQTTDKAVTVKSFQPEGKTEVKTNITVTFSNDMVPADSIDRPDTSPPLAFEPDIPGIARWIGTNVLRFFPGEPLKPATEYKVKIRSERDWINGNRIKEDRTFEFHTPDVVVDYCSHELSGMRDAVGWVTCYINLYFNYPVDLEDLRKRLTVEGGQNAANTSLAVMSISAAGEPEVDTTVQVYGPVAPPRYAREVMVQTGAIMLTNRRQTYYVRIKEGLLCENGSRGMVNPYEYKMDVRSERDWAFTVQRVEPRTSGKNGVIDVSFSSRVVTEDIRDYITIEPEVDFTVESRWSGVYLRGHFEPGKVYQVSIAAGLRAANEAVLQNDFSTAVSMGDLKPSVAFSSTGVFLPREGRRLLEVTTVNLDTVSVEIEHVFLNNLVYYLSGGFVSGRGYGRGLNLVGRSLFVKDMPLPEAKNEELLSTIDVGGIVTDTLRGVFLVSARAKNNRWTSDSREVMITDIGISARLAEDYLMVWVNSLATATAMKDATVKLFSRNNQLLVEGKTDSRGIAVFENLSRATEGFDPFVITVEREGDLSYLKFNDCLLPTSDFDVSGRPYLTGGYEAFIYMDRGVYRPGKTAHMVSVVRGRDCKTPEEFPYRATIFDPRGKEYKTFRLSTADGAMTGFDLDLPAFAQTGKYSVAAFIGEKNEIGRTTFLVEEFVPDRIKVEVSCAQDTFVVGQDIVADVTGKFLFGPPASGHHVSGHITLEMGRFEPPGFTSYTFEDFDRKFVKQEIDLKDTLLNDAGGFTYTHSLPATITAPSSLKGLIWGTVSEQGGRAVSAFKEIIVHPYQRYLGIKRTAEGYAAPNEPVTAEVIALTAAGEPGTADDIEVRFYRVVYNTVLKQQNGRYRWVSERTDQLIDSTTIDVSIDGGRVEFTPADYGRYKIVARDGIDGHAAALTFYASGWGYAPWSMEEPDKLQLDLDQELYEDGQSARLQVRSPFPGRLLVTVEKDRVLDFITVDMKENTAEIDVPVRAEYFPNAYITATLIKRAPEVDSKTPARAFGMIPLKLSPASRTLDVAIEAVGVMSPKARLPVDVSTGSGRARVTIAAVDAGILQLTDFQTPDPVKFFHGQRRAILSPYDIYSYIYPDIAEAESHLSPSGGARFAQARKRHLNPVSARRVEPLALWSGIVETDENGRATVYFDVPQFNGKLVIMAVAVDGDKFGAASSETIVRDKIVIQESFPRFVSPNDIVEGFVTLFNNTGREAGIDVSLDFDGPAALVTPSPQKITLADNTEGQAIFRFRAAPAPGVIKCTISAASGTDRTAVSFELPNRPGQPLAVQYGSGALMRDSTASFVLPGDWVPTTDRYVVRTSSLSALSFKRNIECLLAYPYGCLEQTTSRVFPMLYYDDLVKVAQPELFGRMGFEYFLREGIEKILSMKLADRSFAFWSGGDKSHNWSSIYASHFLIEAEKAGYAIDKDTREDVRKYLKDMARGKKYQDISTSHRIYAAYALAKAGEFDKKITNYLRDLDADGLPAHSRYQLAATMAMAGDVDFARSLVPFDIQPDLFEPETGGDLGSGVRTTAILLDMLMEVDPDNPSVGVLVRSLTQSARAGHWYNTQANAFGLMALGRYYRQSAPVDFTGTVTIEGDKAYPIDTSAFEIARDNLAGKEVSVTIKGNGPCYYYWQASGVSSSTVAPEFERGIKVTREYLDTRGGAMDLDSVRLGDQMICHITATAVDRSVSNVVINDLLPAGFEIENPRLASTPGMSWLPKKGGDIDHQDIRDDRLLMFMNLYSGSKKEFYYSLRAVSAGEFKIPPISAECMYNPLIAGASSAGVVTIRGNTGE